MPFGIDLAGPSAGRRMCVTLIAAAALLLIGAALLTGCSKANETEDASVGTIPVLRSAQPLADEGTAEEVTPAATTEIENPEVAKLVASLADPNAGERQRAVRALGEMGEEAAEAVPALVACLNDSFFSIRNNAGAALAAIGEPAVEALTAVAKGGASFAASVAEKALAEISGE